ncbi:uncharacterized protein LOC128742270 [Sabethes cyaneus]|uniref:uncharacterized protein LOC128742270 n=1 Tax=Sabethes cyaneus TaxID=53552 RepID=UPI00237EBFFE|nr:uncharacterized protein LOC128742270 [Sabethes cyaneus]
MSEQQKQLIASHNTNILLCSIPNKNKIHKPQSCSNKTFEQAYRDALEQLNAAAVNVSGNKQCHERKAKLQHVNSIYNAENPATSVINRNPSIKNFHSSREQYTTTIYNINTINLVEMLKQRERNIGTSDKQFEKPVPVSPGNKLKFIEESSKYRQTFSNAFANHLLEQTKNAVYQVAYVQDNLSKSSDSENCAEIGDSMRAFPDKQRDTSIRLKLEPSLIQTTNQKLYNQLYNHIPHSPSSFLPNVADVENRSKILENEKKSKISSPAPNHIYGKPAISITSSTSSTGHIIKELNKKTCLDFETSINQINVEPPPAHSSISIKIAPSSNVFVPPMSASVEKPKMDRLPNSFYNNTQTAQNPSVISDAVLNLDTKISMSLEAVSRKNTSKSIFSQFSVGQNSSIIQKTDNSHRSIPLNTSLLKRYSKIKVTNDTMRLKESTIELNENMRISEQKTRLLELLQNANGQDKCHDVEENGIMHTKSLSVRYKNAAVSKSAISMRMNYTKKISDQQKIRTANSEFNSNKRFKPRDISVESRKITKRKNKTRLPSSKNKRKRIVIEYSTEPYLQNGPCYQVAPKLPRCRECGRSAAARSRASANIFCRFIAFRKLRRNHEGRLEVVGFANPNIDPQDFDTSLWNANLTKVPSDLSVEKSKFLLGQVGYKFCELFHQEKEAYFEHMAQDKTIAWKKAVQGVREICDVCSTTLFNYHWVCSVCGFVVCIDCYKGRKHGYSRHEASFRDRDEYMWLHCSNRQPHHQQKLLLTQIIPSNCLYKLVRQMHGICALLEVPLNCECPLSKESLFRKIKDKLEFMYPVKETQKSKKYEVQTIDYMHDKNENLDEDFDDKTITKMISITIKNIESMLSETSKETVRCKVIFGRELSVDKNSDVEFLNRREKQSYDFEGFQNDIMSESDVKATTNEIFFKDRNVTECFQTINYSLSTENKENSNSGLSDDKCAFNVIEVAKTDLFETPENNTEAAKGLQDRPLPNMFVKQEIEAMYNEEHRFKSSPNLDWKTFNMIVKQLLKFDKVFNISGLFEKHLTENYLESQSLVDFTAEIEVKHANIQRFLHDFLNQFVFITGHDEMDNISNVQILEYNKHIKTGLEFRNKGERITNLEESQKLYPNVAHQWLCNGRLLRLLDPLNDRNYSAFHDQWERGQPVMISYVSNKMDINFWLPKSFANEFGEEVNDLINCLNGKLVKEQKMKIFWDGFEKIGSRLLDERDRPMLLKLKDWPPGDDFAEMMPDRYADLMKCLPLAEYTRREGRLNLASRLCNFFVKPDLGPKMYSAYGSALHPSKGTTNLHLDVSDAVNVMVHVSVPSDVDENKYIQKVYDAIQREECDIFTCQRVREKNDLPGALWHIYHAQDADKIRSLLNKIEVERGGSIKANHDPIHDQKWYLDANLRKRLLHEYNVAGYAIVQCAGDAIFIPAGAPHQVRNLHNCIKVAEDFVSPENISYCFKLTNEFRHLTNTHSNHEDKLQIKNIIYHTVKDSISCLANPLIMTKDKIELL